MDRCTRWWQSHRWVSDVLLAVAVAVPPRIDAHPGWRPVPVQIAVMALLVLPLFARRQHPRAVALVVAGAALAQYAGQVWGPEIQRGNIALAAVLYTLVVRGLDRDAVRLAVFAAGLTSAWAVTSYPRADAGLRVMTPGATALLFVTAALLGAFNRARRQRLADTERRAALADSEREALARAAVAEERARVAREIHDVLAHSVSVMVLNAEGAKLVRDSDPAAVDRTLDIVAATGREALHDLRVLLDVLRTPDADRGDGTAVARTTGSPGTPPGPTAADSTRFGPTPLGSTPLGSTALGSTALGPAAVGPTALGPTTLGPKTHGPTTQGPRTLCPQPGSHDIAPLVARCSLGRAPIAYAFDGEPDTLPGTFALQVHRVVQEALTNLVKHASPDALGTVHVDFGSEPASGSGRSPGPRVVRIEVRNTSGDAPPPALPSAGHGLVGLTERVEMFGGRVHAGPTPDGGFVLRAELPVHRAARPRGPGNASAA